MSATLIFSAVSLWNISSKINHNFQEKKFIHEKSQNLKMIYFDENWLVTIIVRLVEAVVVVESVVVFRRS